MSVSQIEEPDPPQNRPSQASIKWQDKASADSPYHFHEQIHTQGTATDIEDGANKHIDLDKERKEAEDVEDTEVEKQRREQLWMVASGLEVKESFMGLSPSRKVRLVLSVIIRVVLIFVLLYIFICSFDFLGSAFTLLGGKKAGEVFRQSHILSNPLAGMMMGMMVTVLVQSSSTSTSIVISMVAADIIGARMAVPIMIGANIGTSVTSTLVSLGYITTMSEFRLAFAGATVHDAFNLMSAAVLLPLEILSGYLYLLSTTIVDSMHLTKNEAANTDMLKTITKPFTKLIVQVSSKSIENIALGHETDPGHTLLKLCCDSDPPPTCCKRMLAALGEDGYYRHVESGAVPFSLQERRDVCMTVGKCMGPDHYNGTQNQMYKLHHCVDKAWERVETPQTYPELNTLNCHLLPGNSSHKECCEMKLRAASFSKDHDPASQDEQAALCRRVSAECFDETPQMYNRCLLTWSGGRQVTHEVEMFSCDNWAVNVETTCRDQCYFLFRSAHNSQGGLLSDEGIGTILLLLSLVLLGCCLWLLVKLLHSLLKGQISRLLEKFVNADFPGVCTYFTGYLAILVGMGMTVVLQSSSIFVSTLTPFVGVRLIHLERMYPLTLGSNIGTTITGILAALAQNKESIPRSLQVAFCHLFFNISGIAIFYPLPFFRPPLKVAQRLGDITASYRWFAIVYITVVFFLIPLIFFGLSLLGWYVVNSVLVVIVLVALSFGSLRCLQLWRPDLLPEKLRSFHFLPAPLRSLQPYDAIMRKMCNSKCAHDHSSQSNYHHIHTSRSSPHRLTSSQPRKLTSAHPYHRSDVSHPHHST